MRNLAAFSLAFLMIASVFVRTQTRVGGTPSDRLVLERALANIDTSPMPSDEAFQKLLLTADVPGGQMMTQGCDAGWTGAVVRLQGKTLGDVLAHLARADSQYRWTIDDGVVNLVPAKGVPPLLEAHIKVFDSKETGDIVSAGGLLVALPDVRRAAASLGLTQALVSDGLGAIPPGPLPIKKPLGIHLRDVTLIDALNAIVRTNRRGVWAYSETHCNGASLFQVTLSQ